MHPLAKPFARPKNAAATRAAMLDAARKRFLLESYENVGLRDIAGDVGVDVALVGRYFGGKEALFKEVLRHGKEERPVPPITAAELPAHLTCLAMQQARGGDQADLERLLIILRSSSSPQAAEIVRESLSEDVLIPLAALLDGDHAEKRAALAMAVWIGTTVLRNVMAVGPMCDAECEVAGSKLYQLFSAALSEVPERSVGCAGTSRSPAKAGVQD